MSYIDGFVLAVPKANKQKFIDHAKLADPLFMEYGAIRVMECWQDDVPKGKVTDFYSAVKATEGKQSCFHLLNGQTRRPATLRWKSCMKS